MSNVQRLNHEQFETHLRLVQDHDFFCRHIVKIEPKDIIFQPEDQQQFDALWREDSTAGMVPYVKRPGQRKFQAACEAMERELGYVAIAAVKPRQVGWSTEIQSQAYWQCTKTPGLKVLIVSHTRESTGKFLRRLRKMCAAAPPTVTPGRPLENSKEIGFANGAYISIATAGSPDAVRSDNAHFFHGSEETSWENADELAASIFPALSFARGSRAFRETTSKGRNTPWHQFINETIANQNRWRVFFDAYFNEPRYQTPPRPDWEPDDEAREHAAMHLQHLTPQQQLARLYWRAMMIKDLRALWLFKQEYPSTIEESFQSSAERLYNPDAVAKARANGKHGIISLDPHAPLIMGVDPARTGDRTAIVFRQGNVVREFRTWPKMDDMQLVGIIAGYLKDGYKGTKVAKCFIDYAIGEGAASRLRELGFQREILTVHFGAPSMEPRYLNKRAEMFMKARDWLGDTGEHVSVPDHDDFSADLLAMPDFKQATGSDKIQMVAKDEIKKEIKRSPDIADAWVLTFAYPVQAERIAELQKFAKEHLSHLGPDQLTAVVSDFDR